MSIRLSVIYAVIGTFCIIILSLETYAAQESALKGQMDLRNWDFNEQGAAPMDGEWEFYWGQLSGPKKITTASKPDTFLKVPSTWKNVVIEDKKLPGMGMATYRLTVKINPAQKNQVWAVKTLIMGSAYSMWINGSKISAAGTVGMDKSQAVPGAIPQVVFFTADQDQLEVIVQVSNFHHPRGGIWRSIHIGPADIIRDVYRKSLISDSFFIFAYLMICLTHFAHFIVYRKRISELYFCCICLIIAIRTGFTGEHVMLAVTGAWNWHFQFKIAGLTIVAAVPLFLMFIDKIFPKLYPPLLLKVIQGVSLIYTGILIFTPVLFWSPLMNFYRLMSVFCIFYLCFLLIVAAVRKVRYAKAVLWGCIILLSTAVNDVLLVNHIIETRYMLSYGIILFIIIQSFLLARTFSNTLQEKTILSQRLAQMEKSQNRIVEKERFRISRELHDEVAQIFSLIKYQTTSKMKIVSRPSQETACTSCLNYEDSRRQIMSLAGKGDTKIRQVMNDLYPPGLDEFGLSSAVQSYTEEMCRKTGIQIWFKQIEEIPRGEKTRELAVFRIIQEAVSNMIKHAKTDSAEVSLGKNEKSVWFQVSDEGRGFQFKINKKYFYHKGRGLFFIQERARQINATIDIHSAPMEGTLVFLSIPISEWSFNTTVQERNNKQFIVNEQTMQ